MGSIWILLERQGVVPVGPRDHWWMMPHLVMSPFDFGKAQVQFGFAFESSMHRSEEHNEGEKMEVDLVVALELQPTKFEVIFGTGIRVL